VRNPLPPIGPDDDPVNSMTTLRLKIIIVFLIPLSFCRREASPSDLRTRLDTANVELQDINMQVRDYSSGDLNYVKALQYNWKRILMDSNAYSTESSDILLQSLSNIGDIKSICKFSEKQLPPYPQLQDSIYLSKFKTNPFKYSEARSFILGQFKYRDIIMFNEGHDRPQTRAFVISLLADLRKAGATCLAMETFDESGNLAQLDVSTGYFTSEPVGGELVREALRLGFKLIPYEDRPDLLPAKSAEPVSIPTSPIEHSANQRDSVQAANLFRRIQTKSGIEKTVVLAGYGHISETEIGDIKCMALNFKKLSGVDPLTVEQTLLSECMKESPYANRLLNTVIQTETAQAFKSNDAKRFGLDSLSYDIYVYHPPTKFIHNRPAWLLNKPSSKFINIKIPRSIDPVLVQAYLKTEIDGDASFRIRIPADQTFYSENNSVWLVLRSGLSYKIVYRDTKNKILHVKDLDL
jgi:hypothetical protein